MTTPQLTPEESAKVLKLLEDSVKKQPKPAKPKKEMQAEYEVVTIGEGKNVHSTFTEPLSKGSFEDARFVKPRTLLDRIRGKIRFLVVVKDEPTNQYVTLREPTRITSELLYIAESSHSLKNAIMGLFQKPFHFGFGGRKVVFIIIIGVIGVVAYLVISGNLNLGSILGQKR